MPDAQKEPFLARAREQSRMRRVRLQRANPAELLVRHDMWLQTTSASTAAVGSTMSDEVLSARPQHVLVHYLGDDAYQSLCHPPRPIVIRQNHTNEASQFDGACAADMLASESTLDVRLCLGVEQRVAPISTVSAATSHVTLQLPQRATASQTCADEQLAISVHESPLRLFLPHAPPSVSQNLGQPYPHAADARPSPCQPPAMTRHHARHVPSENVISTLPSPSLPLASFASTLQCSSTAGTVDALVVPPTGDGKPPLSQNETPTYARMSHHALQNQEPTDSDHPDISGAHPGTFRPQDAVQKASVVWSGGSSGPLEDGCSTRCDALKLQSDEYAPASNKITPRARAVVAFSQRAMCGHAHTRKMALPAPVCASCSLCVDHKGPGIAQVHGASVSRSATEECG